MGTVDIDEWFKLYLRLVHLEELSKDSIQYRELKHAFFGAVGMTLVFLELDMENMTAEDTEKNLTLLKSQINELFGGFFFQ